MDRNFDRTNLVVTLPVAGHDATLPDTVLTTTWYVRPGLRFSVNLAFSGAPLSTICGVLRRIPMATYKATLISRGENL